MLNVGIIPVGAAVEETTALCGSAPRRGKASLGDMGYIAGPTEDRASTIDLWRLGCRYLDVTGDRELRSTRGDCSADSAMKRLGRGWPLIVRHDRLVVTGVSSLWNGRVRAA